MPSSIETLSGNCVVTCVTWIEPPTRKMANDPAQQPNAYERLLNGLRDFQRNVYPGKRGEYERLAREGQNPHTLFIACADSRVDPALLTQCGPGEIFVARNIGNVIPAYGEALGGVSALVEYAATALQVDQVVICGHTDCGAMKALLNQEQLANMPTVKLWLRSAEAALSVVQALEPELARAEALDKLTKENVLLQMNHLRTHPSIAGRLARRSLAIYGWVYDIASGSVRMYDEQQNEFLSFS